MKGTFRTAMATALLCGATVFAFGPTASAATTPQPESQVGVALQAPTAPSGTQWGSWTTARTPSISPAVTVTSVAAGQSYTCSSGTLCTVVWNPVAGNFSVFHLYTCRTYALSYWNGPGNWYDNQTGGVRSYYYGASGNVITTFTSGQNVSQDWTPVYKIKNC